MAGARYWRLVGLSSHGGGDLELAAAHLYSSAGRVDHSAVLTCTFAPAAGSLGNLQDTDISTLCMFAGADVRASGFSITWDLGVGASEEVIGVRFGASLQGKFIAGATLQSSSDNNSWKTVSSFGRYVYPGDGQMTATPVYGLIPTTLNPADKSGAVVLSAGNLTAEVPVYNGVRSIFGASAGQFYFEIAQVSGAMGSLSGVANSSATLAQYPGGGGAGWGLFFNSGSKFFGGSGSAYAAATSPSTRPVGVCLDMDAGTVGFVVNNVNYGVAFSGLTGTVYAQLGIGSATTVMTCNFGGAAFSNDVPAGYHHGFGELVGGGTLYEPFPKNLQRSAAILAASAAVPAFSTRRTAPLQLARDVEVGGPGTIYGTTKTKGTPNAPTKARVVLLHQRSKLPVRETWSDPVTGAFAFTGIDTNQQFLTLAEDAAGNFRPVAANRLTPEVL